MTALATDFDRMDADTARLRAIGQEFITDFNTYLSMNQNLTGPGIGGTAGTASLGTAERGRTAGIRAGSQWNAMCDAIASATAGYRDAHQRNTAALGAVGG